MKSSEGHLQEDGRRQDSKVCVIITGSDSEPSSIGLGILNELFVDGRGFATKKRMHTPQISQGAMKEMRTSLMFHLL